MKAEYISIKLVSTVTDVQLMRRSAIFYESIHWPEVTPSYIITTLQSLFKRGICSLRHLHVNFSSSVDSDSESPNSAARTSMNESDQYSKDQSDDKSTIFHHDLHIPQFRVQFKTFLARTIDRFKCSVGPSFLINV